MKSINSFKPFNDEKSQEYLANHYPKGKLTQKRFDSDSIIYKFILCISTFIKIFTGEIYIIAKNTNIDLADELLPEWEEAFGIPERYGILPTIAERREAVKRKKSKIPVTNINLPSITNEYTTYEHYVKVMTGYNIQGYLFEGNDFPLIFPFAFTGTSTNKWLTLFFYVEIVPENFLPAEFPVNLYQGLSETQRKAIEKALDDIIPAYSTYVLTPVEELPT